MKFMMDFFEGNIMDKKGRSLKRKMFARGDF